jgi:hypothetical protein
VEREMNLGIADGALGKLEQVSRILMLVFD